MADLLTHLATVYVPTRLTVRNPAGRSLVYLGVCLPDVVTRAGTWVRVPGNLAFHDIVHTPIFVALVALATSQLFATAWRRQAFGAILFGGLAHVLLDAGKDSLGGSGLLWGFPFTLRSWEWGGYLREETVYFMVPSLLAILVTEAISRAVEARLSQRSGIPRRGPEAKTPAAL